MHLDTHFLLRLIKNKMQANKKIDANLISMLMLANEIFGNRSLLLAMRCAMFSRSRRDQTWN